MSSISSFSRRLQPARDLATTLPADPMACGSLLLLTLAFAWPAAALGYLPTSGDFILQYYPNLAFLGNSLKAGEIPLWNPLLFAGTPYLADPQSQLLYFPDWPFLFFLDSAGAARAVLLAHFVLATLAMYGYLRVIRLSPYAAFLGAAVYGLGRYAFQQVAWTPMLMSLAWIPLVLLFVERALARRSLVWVTLAAVALTVQFFNGWPHGSYITAFAVMATVLQHAVTRMASARSWRPALPVAAVAVAIAGITAALTSPLWLPFLEYWGQSTYITDRGIDAAAAEGNVTVLAILGVGGSEGHGAYIGVVTLVLGALGALFSRNRSRAWTFAGLAAFGLLVAFGANTPTYGYLYQWIPGFRTFHMPGRFMVLYVLSASVLAAMGAETLLHLSGRRLAVSVSAAVLLLGTTFTYTLGRMLGSNAPVLLAGNLLRPESGPYLDSAMAGHIGVATIAAVLVLLTVGSNRVPRAPAFYLTLLLLLGDIFLYQARGATYFASPPAILRSASPAPAIQQIASAENEPFRVAGYQQNGTIHFMSDLPFNLNSALVPPNLSLMDGLEDLQGYLPLQPRRYAEYLAAVNGGPQDYHWALISNFQSPLLDLLNLRYVMVRDNDRRIQNVTIATNVDLNRPSAEVVIRPQPLLTAGLQVHSYLGNAVDVEDGRAVGKISVLGTEGEQFSLDLRAGIETAEWAHDRPDVAARVRHARAPVATTRNLPSPTQVYLASLTFPRPITISRIAVERTEPAVELAVPEIVAIPANPNNRYEKAGEMDGATVYRNTRALPRALLVPRAEVASTSEEALQRLLAPDFDPRKEVILEGTGQIPTSAGVAAEVGEVHVRARSNNEVRLSVQARSPGFLLLNELSYPGWSAYLDGKRVEVWRANYLFRAIEVSPGEHDVQFRFEPDSLKLGLAISLSTLALLLMAIATLRLRSRQQRKETGPI